MDNETDFESSYAHPGSVRYMSAPAVRRGMRIPGNIKLIIAGIGLVGLVLASLLGMRAYSDVVDAPARYAESIQTAINGGQNLELPVLNNLVDSDSAGIRDVFANTGYTTIDVDALYAREGEELDPFSIDLVKVPSDIDYDRSVELFQSNLRRVDVTEAAHFLAGSWRFTSYLSEGTDLKVKYAEFNAATIEEAIMAGIAAQGWSDSTFGENGVDQSGNTYQNGSVQVNDRTLRWTVSACPLDEVYNINGLPENSFYVGARLVQ